MKGTMKVLIAYDAAAADGDVDARDVLNVNKMVAGALRRLGHEPECLAVTLDLFQFRDEIKRRNPGVVFNLVESMAGSDRLQHFVPSLLEEWGVPFTGCSSGAAFRSNHKLRAKRSLISHGVATPEAFWMERGCLASLPESFPDEAVCRHKWIVKAAEAHASQLLDADAICGFSGRGELEAKLIERGLQAKMLFFAERYVDGREFNVSLLADEDGYAITLPPVEMQFAGGGGESPNIVDYAAKWGLPGGVGRVSRKLDFPDSDWDLLKRLSRTAKACWRALRLTGYARVDFRVDREGKEYVLEVNTNPCLSDDASFTDAALRMGWSYDEMIGKILVAANGLSV